MTRLLLAALALLPAAAAAAEPLTRTFRFTYQGTATGLDPGQKARVWVPVPQTTDDQTILRIVKRLPADATPHSEPVDDNKMYYMTAKADADGNIPFTFVYTVRRKEVVGETDRTVRDDLEKYLKANALAPADGKHLKLIEGKTLPSDPMAKAKEFYEIVNGTLRYAKEGTEWGRGDVNWVCDSRFGNCTDFHSLFIALARAEKIPARFEIGFGLPEQRGSGEIAGYHCWAKFKPPGKGWVPVDISEANKNPKMKEYYFGNLTENRVTFSTGRDLVLEPKQDGPPLNFFVYPYVEVDGKPYPASKVKTRFAYSDVD
jgi:transglutaminase-like putative cysteine protease